jgi:hypothetical protein
MCRQILLKLPNITCYENPFSHFRVVTCTDGRTDKTVLIGAPQTYKLAQNTGTAFPGRNLGFVDRGTF